MPKFSFITTCKGRLHHLQQTLPLMLQQADSECIVVDYNCPQKSGDWVSQHHPQAKVARNTTDTGWCAAAARNQGANLASGEWLVFIDADIRLADDLLGWLSPRLAPGKTFRAEIMRDKLDIFGTFVCHRDDFLKVEGYDEVLRGWGKEDNDIYYRLRMAGCTEFFFPASFLNPIPHDDSARVEFLPYSNRWIGHIISSLYLQMKYDATQLQPGLVTQEMRLQLFEHARQNVLRITSQGPGADRNITITLGDHPGLPSMNPLYGIQRTLVYTLMPLRA